MKKKKAAALLLTLGLTVGGNGTVVFAAEPGVETPAVETQQEIGAAEKNKTAEETGEAAVTAKPVGTETAAVEEDEAAVSRIVSFTDYTGMRVTYDANISKQYAYEVEGGILKAVRWKGTDADAEKAEDVITFEGNVELKQPEEGEKYTSVAANVFGGNQSITYVKLPVGVTTIADGSFKGCSGLKSVHLPSTVTAIGDSAFEDCTAMTQISVPKSVTVIGDSAFKGDAKLQTVQIREAASGEVPAVGVHAFEGCRSLQQISFPQAEAAAGEDSAEEDTKVTTEGEEN